MYARWPHRHEAPPLVLRAVAAAEALDFPLCVHPATGRLLHVLAGGVPAGGRIGETGTGTGAGLAWMATAAPTGTELVSVEPDAERAASARELFDEHPKVTLLEGDAQLVFDRGPYDLLVLDGGWGSGKRDDPTVDPLQVLKPGGMLTVDDLTPDRPVEADAARRHWLEHPALWSTEVRVAPDCSVLLCRRR
jgi:predicted O-methyltransferase YrrM